MAISFKCVRLVLAAVATSAILTAAPVGAAPRWTPLHITRSAGAHDESYELVFVGWTRSDVAERSELLRTLREVILPGAARRHARVVLAITSGATSTEPRIVGTASLDAHSEAQGNPVLERRLERDRINALLGSLTKVLGHLRPALSSDWIGALRLAAQLRGQYPARARTEVVLVGDALNTQPGCALEALDLSPRGRAEVLAGCIEGVAPDLHGMRFAFVGAGVDQHLPAVKAAQLEAWYRWAIRQLGGKVSCYAAVLITDCVPGRAR